MSFGRLLCKRHELGINSYYMSAIIKFYMQGALISFPAPFTDYGTCNASGKMVSMKVRPQGVLKPFTVTHSAVTHSADTNTGSRLARQSLRYMPVYLSSPSSQDCSVFFSCITVACKHARNQAFGQLPNLLEAAHVEDRLMHHCCRQARLRPGFQAAARPSGSCAYGGSARSPPPPCCGHRRRPDTPAAGSAPA